MRDLFCFSPGSRYIGTGCFCFGSSQWRGCCDRYVYSSLVWIYKEMTIGQLLADTQYGQKTMLQKLIMHYCVLSREEMRMQSDTEILDAHLHDITSWYKKYVDEKMPLEYIVGKVTFLGNDFVVNKHTLIPRPETEYMIEAINEYMKSLEVRAQILDFVLLDVGTGCGVLGLSVLLHNPGTFSWSILSDFSPDALEVAKTNYRLLVESWKLKVESEGIEFVHSSLLDFIDTSWITASSLTPHPKGTSSLSLTARNDQTNMIAWKDVILVANLPYIPDAMFDANVDETVKKWEPRMAFVGGDDGLDLYREMFEQLFRVQSSEFRAQNIVLFLEMMTWQIDILRAEFGDRMLFEEVKTFHFNIRIVKASLLG